MKQILQSLETGSTEVAEIPCPAVWRGQVLIRSNCTLVSAGAECMLVEFGKAGWIEKPRQQPDKVRMVVDKIKTDGLIGGAVQQAGSTAALGLLHLRPLPGKPRHEDVFHR